MTTTKRRIPSQLPKFFYEIADRRYFREHKSRGTRPARYRMLNTEYLAILRDVCKRHDFELIN